MDKALSAANVLLAVMLVVSAIRLKGKCTGKMCIFRRLFVVVGGYLAGIYVYVLLANFGVLPTADPVMFGRVFVRPLMTMILGLLTALVAAIEQGNEENG